MHISLFRYLRSTAYDIYLRRSRRLKQLISRMHQMIENNIHEYPGDKATVAEYFQSIGCKLAKTKYF